MFNLNELGPRIAQRRKALGLTQDQLARQLDLSPQAISKWETGAGMPDIASLPYLAKALDVSIDALFGVEDLADESRKLTKETPVEETVSSEPDLDFVYQYEDWVLLSNLRPSKTQGAVVSFEDGSQANLLTRSVMNMGNGQIVIEDLQAYRASQGFVPSHDVPDHEEEGPEATEETSGQSLNEELHPHLKDVRSLQLDLANHTDIRIVPVDKAEDIAVLFLDQTPQEDYFVLIDGDCLTLRDQSREKTSFFPLFGKRVQWNSSFQNEKRLIEIHLLKESHQLSIDSSGASDILCQVNFEEANFTISGAGDLKAQCLSNVTYRGSGAGNVSIDRVHNLKISSSGASDVHLKQATGDISAHMSGAGNLAIDAGELEHLTIHNSGVGDVEASQVTTGALDCALSGHSRVVIGRVLGPSRERVSPFSSLKILARK